MSSRYSTKPPDGCKSDKKICNSPATSADVKIIIKFRQSAE